MNDTIYRQAAIDALGKAPKYKVRIIKTYAEGRNDQWFDDVTKLSLVPSAQPEGKWINADAIFHIQVYDDEHEEFTTKEMSLADILDAYTDEGCQDPGAAMR